MDQHQGQPETRVLTSSASGIVPESTPNSMGSDAKAYLLANKSTPTSTIKTTMTFIWDNLTWEKCELSVIFLIFVFTRAIDRIFSKRVSDRMANYTLMYYNVLWPIGVQAMTVVLSGCWIAYHRFQLNDKRYDLSFFSPFSRIATADGHSYPQWRLAVFSLWDQINASVTGIPSPYISQNDQGIMTNFGIVWTLLISIPYNKTSYFQEHYIGCILIFMSGMVSIVVNLQTNDPPLGEYATASGALKASSGLWYVIYVLGTVPVGISNCYKQKCLKSVDLEVMYATLWSGFWQIMWGFLLFPINWIPLPEPASQNYAGETGEFVARSWDCFMGHIPMEDFTAGEYPSWVDTTLLNWQAPPPMGNWSYPFPFSNTSLPYNPSDDVCAASGGSAGVWFIAYILFNVSFNLLLLWLTKRMSGTWAQIGTVLCLDLASVLSQSKALMGDEAEVLTLQQWFGLVLAGLAMWVYNLKDEIDFSGNLVAGADMKKAVVEDGTLVTPLPNPKSEVAVAIAIDSFS